MQRTEIDREKVKVCAERIGIRIILIYAARDVLPQCFGKLDIVNSYAAARMDISEKAEELLRNCFIFAAKDRETKLFTVI